MPKKRAGLVAEYGIALIRLIKRKGEVGSEGRGERNEGRKPRRKEGELETVAREQEKRKRRNRGKGGREGR